MIGKRGLVLGRSLGLIAVAAAAILVSGPARAAGLPQLDVSTYGPQVIWLGISFFLLYLLLSKMVLPRVGRVLDERQQRIEANLERAAKLKADADAAKAAYEKGLADARTQAQDVLHQTAERLAAAANDRHASLAARLAQDVKSAEARIEEAKRQAIAGIRDAAVDTAVAASRKLLGDVADAKMVGEAVDSVLGERR